MNRNACVLLSLSVASAILSGCNEHNLPLTSTDLQNDEMDKLRTATAPNYTNMADNAILQDMSVADFHFVGHTDEISGTGAAKLNRMAALLNTYGGTVRYETDLKDEKLVNRRLEHVKEYLAVSGCDMSRVELKAGMAGSRGMAADKAVDIERKGTARPGESSSGGAPMGTPTVKTQ